MRKPVAVLARVFVDREVAADAERELIAALAAAGVHARSRVAPARRGPEQLHWLVLIAVPLQAFLSSVGEAAAADAWSRAKAVLRRLAGGRLPEQARPIVLQDPDTGLQIVLSPNLCEEAYGQL